MLDEIWASFSFFFVEANVNKLKADMIIRICFVPFFWFRVHLWVDFQFWFSVLIFKGKVKDERFLFFWRKFNQIESWYDHVNREYWGTLINNYALYPFFYLIYFNHGGQILPTIYYLVAPPMFFSPSGITASVFRTSDSSISGAKYSKKTGFQRRPQNLKSKFKSCGLLIISEL